MFQRTQPTLSWLILLLSIIHIHVFGMRSDDNSLINNTYELDELREKFGTILETQPEFINLNSTEFQYKSANGIYKLIPYYQKAEQPKAEESRFIIHKHVISGQWQLTEFDAYPLSKNIKAFPVTEEDEKIKLMTNRYTNLIERVQEMEKNNENFEKEKKSLKKNINYLTKQNESLDQSNLKNEKEIQDLKMKLILKENEINYSNSKFKNCEESLTALKLTNNKQREIENERLKYFLDKSEKTLIDKEFEIKKLMKEKKKSEFTLVGKQNYIQSLNCELLKRETLNNKLDSEVKTLKEQKEKSAKNLCAKQNQIQKLEFENNSREKILNQEIEDLHKIIFTLEKQLEEKLQKYESQEKAKSDKNLGDEENQIHDLEETPISHYQKSNESLEPEIEKLKQQDKDIMQIKVNSLQNFETEKTKKEFKNLESKIENKKVTVTNKNDQSTKKLENNFTIKPDVLFNLVQTTTEQKKEVQIEHKEATEKETINYEIPIELKQNKKNILHSKMELEEESVTKNNEKSELDFEKEGDILCNSENVEFQKLIQSKIKKKKNKMTADKNFEAVIQNTKEKTDKNLETTTSQNDEPSANTIFKDVEKNFNFIYDCFKKELELHQDDEEVMIKIRFFVSNPKFFEGNSTYEYESIFVRYGIVLYMEDHIKKIEENSDGVDYYAFTVNLRMMCWWKKKGKSIYVDYLHDIQIRNHMKIESVLKYFVDTKTAKKCALLMMKNNNCLKTYKYRYEYFLVRIGYVLHGAAETVNHLNTIFL